MVIRVEHELHTRRRGRNVGVGLLLVGFIGIVFGLTVVKVMNLTDIKQFESFDHVARPQIIPEDQPAATEPATPEPAAPEPAAPEPAAPE